MPEQPPPEEWIKRPARRIVIDPWRISDSVDNRILYWIVPGYTHVIGTVN